MPWCKSSMPLSAWKPNKSHSHLQYTIPPAVALTFCYYPLSTNLAVYKILFLIAVGLQYASLQSVLNLSRSLSFPPLHGIHTSSTLEYGHILPTPSLARLSSESRLKRSSFLSSRPTIPPFSTSSSASPHSTQSIFKDRSYSMTEGV